MSDYRTSVQSIGIDTLTCSAGDDDHKPYLQSLGCYLLMRSAGQGNRVGYFKRGPYVGGQTRSVGYAEHQGRGLVELRGETARDWGPLILPWSEKVSRIDVQVTVAQEPYDDRLAWRAWEEAIDRAKAEGRPPRYTLWADSSRGSTLYIGRLGSRFLGRVYEKAKEDPKGGWPPSWRYEVQARRERAQQVAMELGRQSQPEPWIAGTVADHFSKRGVQPIYTPQAAYSLGPLPPENSDETKALRWLSSSVAPVLDRFQGEDARAKALRALGLPVPDERD